MHKPIIVLLCLAIAQTTYSQSANNDLALLLKPGKHLAGIMNFQPRTRTAREMELTGKVMQAAIKNMQWFKDSLSTVKDITAHFDKFGLTKEEFEEYQVLSADKQEFTTSVTAQDTLEIFEIDQQISFRGNGRLAVLDSLRIDLRKDIASFRRHDIPYERYRQENDNNNPFKAPWKGHVYSFEDNGQTTAPNNPADVKNMSFARYSVMAGKLTNSGKTVLMLMAMKMEKGRMVMNIMMSCVID